MDKKGENMASNLFSTIPEKDYLSLYEGKTAKLNRIAKYLKFNHEEVAKATGVPKSSVRKDNKMSKVLRDRINEWANLLNLVAGYFDGDGEKTVQWLITPNPLLGDISPRDMIRLGRYKKLIKFVLNALTENTSQKNE